MRSTWIMASLLTDDVVEVTLPVEVAPVVVLVAEALPVVDVACPSIPTSPYPFLSSFDSFHTSTKSGSSRFIESFSLPSFPHCCIFSENISRMPPPVQLHAPSRLTSSTHQIEVHSSLSLSRYTAFFLQLLFPLDVFATL